MTSLNCSVCFPIIRKSPILIESILSCFCGSIIPDQLIFIDQSSSANLHEFLQKTLEEIPKSTKIIYIESQIRGLVYAKALATLYCTSDIIIFGEDDLVLPSKYLDGIIKFFTENLDQVGTCCLIDEPEFTIPQTLKQLLLRSSRILYDPRQSLSRATGKLPRQILSSKLYGGSSAWRISTLRKIPFEPNRILHYTEDIYHSMLVNQSYGYPCTSILTNFHAKHFSITNKNRYKINIFKQRVYEEFLLIITFSPNPVEAAWSYLLLSVLRLSEIILNAPIATKPVLSLVVVFSAIDSLLPCNSARTSYIMPREY